MIQQQVFTWKALNEDFPVLNPVQALNKLKHQVLAKQHSALIAPRLWGTQHLVEETAQHLSIHTNIRFIQFDLFAVRDYPGFLSLWLSTLMSELVPKFEEWMPLLHEYLHMTNFQLNYRTMDVPTIQIDTNQLHQAPVQEAILGLADRLAKAQGLHLVLCVNHFEQVLRFDEWNKHVKHLQTAWSGLQHVNFIFYGESRHGMRQLFDTPKRALYNFANVQYVQALDIWDWIDPIKSVFKTHNKKCGKKYALQIAELMHGHPYHVLMLANCVFARCEQQVNQSTVDAAIQDLLGFQDQHYRFVVKHLSNTQLNCLEAIMRGETQLSSWPTIQQYRLNSSANVVKIKRALQQKDIIDVHEGNIQMIDPGFELWLRKVYFAK